MWSTMCGLLFIGILVCYRADLLADTLVGGTTSYSGRELIPAFMLLFYIFAFTAYFSFSCRKTTNFRINGV